MAQAGLNYFEDAEIRKGTIELDSEAAKIVSYLIQQSRREHVSSDADSDSDSDADHHSHAASPDECHSTMSDDEDDTPADAAPVNSVSTRKRKLLPKDPDFARKVEMMQKIIAGEEMPLKKRKLQKKGKKPQEKKLLPEALKERAIVLRSLMVRKHDLDRFKLPPGDRCAMCLNLPSRTRALCHIGGGCGHFPHLCTACCTSLLQNQQPFPKKNHEKEVSWNLALSSKLPSSQLVVVGCELCKILFKPRQDPPPPLQTKLQPQTQQQTQTHTKMQKQQQEVQAFFCALMSSILVTKKEIRDARANPDALLAWLAFYKKLHGDVSSQLHQNLSLPNTPQEHSKLNQWLRQQKRLLVNQRKAGKTTTVEAKQGRRPRKAGKTTTVEAKDESEDEVVVVREFMTINYYHSSG